MLATASEPSRSVDVRASPLGAVIPVDEDEVHLFSRLGEPLELKRQEHVAVAGAQLNVVELLRGRIFRLDQVKGDDSLASAPRSRSRLPPSAVPISIERPGLIWASTPSIAARSPKDICHGLAEKEGELEQWRPGLRRSLGLVLSLSIASLAIP